MQLLSTLSKCQTSFITFATTSDEQQKARRRSCQLIHKTHQHPAGRDKRGQAETKDDLDNLSVTQLIHDISLSLSHTRTHTHTHSLSLSLSLHTHTLSLHTHTHTQPHTLSLSLYTHTQHTSYTYLLHTPSSPPRKHTYHTPLPQLGATTDTHNTETFINVR